MSRLLLNQGRDMLAITNKPEASGIKDSDICDIDDNSNGNVTVQNN